MIINSYQIEVILDIYDQKTLRNIVSIYHGEFSSKLDKNTTIRCVLMKAFQWYQIHAKYKRFFISSTKKQLESRASSRVTKTFEYLLSILIVVIELSGC